MKTGACRDGAGAAWEGVVLVMFSSGGVDFPEWVDGLGEDAARGGADFVLLPADDEGALAMGTGNGVLVDFVVGAGSTGTWVVAGAAIMGACCGCAVGCGCVRTTGGRPL